jgi:cytochrome b subunit of formate dehydrogenase
MSTPIPPRRRPPWARRPPSAAPLARLALALYPPSWRDRYADEVRALLDDSGAGPGAVASLAWRALPAWIWPPAQRHDRPARVRSHLATALMAGAMLAGLGLVFAQLTQLQHYPAPGHPLIGWSYAVFDVALAVAALGAGLGGLPLWLLMLRQACRRRPRSRDLAWLLAPVVAPVTYLAGVAVSAPVPRVPGPSLWWFGAVTAAGFAFAALAAAGPGVALRRLQPRGPALRLAARAGGVAAAALVVAAVAIVVAVTGLCLWAPGFPGYHQPALPGVFLALVMLAAAVTAVSATRGTRAAVHTEG